MDQDTTRRVHRLRRAAVFEIVCALAGFSALAEPAVPQRPTQSEIAAIRQACRADYRAHCKDVPTGGAAALACLRRNASSVSPACQGALGAIGSTHGSSWLPPASVVFVAAATSRPGAQPMDESWPHSIAADGASVTIYEPQAIAWPDHQALTARTAVAITPAGADKPILGTIEVRGATQTDFETRTVVVSDLSLQASNFPMLTTEQAARLEDRIKAALAAMGPKRVPLDTVLLSLKDSQAQPEAVSLKNDPPAIYYSDHPASLVVFDGEPVLAPVPGSTLSVAVNTNWDVFFDPADTTWYLLDNGAWLAARDPKGPWAPVATLPAAFASLPDDPNFAQVRKSIPGQHRAAGAAPTVFVSTVPAEIIVTDGLPAFVPIPGTGLRYVSNTVAELFQDSGSGQFYYLVSGRWFSAPGLDGPWTFATPSLPADFARIPPDGPKGQVLASVPGTQQAQQAVLQAAIPRQASLKRGAAKLDVTYGGAPQFKPIEGTDMAYAVNTSYDVIRLGAVYYACWQGAWFKAPTPTGPWVLADDVPPAIYTIPPSNPLYHTTYVHVYSATPETVTYGYTAGYMMGFVTAGVLAYGTGWYYPPVVVPGPVPGYFPYPYSYAGNVRYNPYDGAWVRGGTVSGPYASATGGTAYNPATGAWARGGAVYGPNGGAGAWSAYNPTTGSYAHGSASWGTNGGTANASYYNARTGVSGSTNQNYNAYSRWGSSVATGPNATVRTESGSNARGSAGAFSSTTGAEGAGYHGAGGNSGGAVKGAGGNVYAGADGNVYRHTSDGWSKWDNGSWNPVQKPANPAQKPVGAGTSQQRSANRNATMTAANAGQSGQDRATRSHTGQPRQPGAASAGRSPATGTSSYAQLEQDRMARSQGGLRQAGSWRAGGAGAESFGARRGGGSRGGEEFGGGGRFRR